MRKAEKWVYKMMHGGKIKKKFYRLLLRIIYSCDFPDSVQVGDNLILPHNGLGMVIHPKSKIGNNCKLYHGITLGGNGKIVDGKTVSGGPVLEDNVAVFCGACVLGPITIGHDSYIGANAVVTKDVPPNSLVYGNPAVITERTFEYDFG